MSMLGRDWAWQVRGLQGRYAARIVLLYLGEQHNVKQGVAFPSIARICRDADMPSSTVRHTLGELEEWGLVSRINNGNQYKRTEYKLHFEVLTISGSLESEVPTTDSEVPTISTPIKEVEPLGTVKEPILPHVEEKSSTHGRKKWEPPEWFEPLTVLEGYKRIKHARSVEAVEAYCREAGVSPSDVVLIFKTYWLAGRIQHGWKDPVKAFRNTIEVQVSKVLKASRAPPRTSPSANGAKPLTGKTSHGNVEKYIAEKERVAGRPP